MNNSFKKAPIGVRFKFVLLANYWWMFGVLLIGTVISSFVFDLALSELASLFAVSLSGLYFLQKQKLEELQTFRDIFENCNKRYDNLNEKLDEIISSEKETLSDTDRKILVDYFNLCAEEYLYYCKGYIYPEVWKAWYNGMCFYLKDQRFYELWLKESSADSHYGLRFENANEV